MNRLFVTTVTLSFLLCSKTILAGEFQPIFDGKTLQGWKAEKTSYWSVGDDAITGELTPQNLGTSNQFLIWQGGEVVDYELKLKFRVKGNGGSSGVQFRSIIRPDGLAVGYQADIFCKGPYLGGAAMSCIIERGPNFRPQMVRKRSLMKKVGTPQSH